MSLSVALTVTFIVLKLTHVIAWSWLWVLAPVWIGAALALLWLTCGLSIFINHFRR